MSCLRKQITMRTKDFHSNQANKKKLNRTNTVSIKFHPGIWSGISLRIFRRFFWNSWDIVRCTVDVFFHNFLQEFRQKSIHVFAQSFLQILFRIWFKAFIYSFYYELFIEFLQEFNSKYFRKFNVVFFEG